MSAAEVAQADLLDELAEIHAADPTPVSATLTDNGHMELRSEARGRPGHLLYLLNLGGYMAIDSGGVDLTPDEARAVADHLTAWADSRGAR